jgi:hypothetical protein
MSPNKKSINVSMKLMHQKKPKQLVIAPSKKSAKGTSGTTPSI